MNLSNDNLIEISEYMGQNYINLNSNQDGDALNDINFIKYLKGLYKDTKIITIKREPNFVKFQKRFKVIKDKSKNSSETVDWFISILEDNFYKSPFKIAHFSFRNSPGTWSAFCSIYNKYWEIFSAFGKGLTIELSMASAYGELIERLQAGFFFSNNPYKPILTHNYLTEQELIKLKDKNNINNILDLNKKFKSMLKTNCLTQHITDSIYHPNLRRFFIFYKFKEILNEKFVWLHSSLFPITTGYAAGNSYEEAFIQAFSEITERYSVFSILKEKIKLPTINKSILSNELNQIIQKIEENNIEIIIKDASLKFGYPVAIILCNFKKIPQNLNNSDFLQKYIISPGSATSFNIAVERSITEIHQAVKNLLNKNLECSKYIQKVELFYKTFPYISKIVPIKNYFIQNFSQKSFIPAKYIEFLVEDVGTETYHNFMNKNLKKEIDHIISKIRDFDFHLYMRDLNFLGIPTVHLFVPELNVGFLSLKTYSTPKIEDFKLKIISSLFELNEEDLIILNEPEFLLNISMNEHLNQFLKINSRILEKINSWFFFGMIALYYKMFDISKKYLLQCLMNERKVDDLIQKLNGKADLISNYFKRIVPNCSNGCENCNHFMVCKFNLCKLYEQNIYNKYTTKFRFL